jgi:hypothetical protein
MTSDQITAAAVWETGEAAATPQPPERDRTVVVTVPPNSRLEALLCLWENVKDKKDAAEAAYDEVKEGILAELRALDPGEDVKAYDIAGTRMYPPLSYSYSRTPYLPAPKIREHIPSVYDAFKQFKESWVLRKKGKR